MATIPGQLVAGFDWASDDAEPVFAIRIDPPKKIRATIDVGATKVGVYECDCSAAVGEYHRFDCARSAQIDPPLCGCGARLNEKHARECQHAKQSDPKRLLLGYQLQSPSAVEINKMMDEAARVVVLRDAEIERLRAENEKLRADQNGRLYYKLRMTTAHEHIERLKAEHEQFRRGSIDRVNTMFDALDEQTQFLAGLDDRRWSKPEQERRRVLVGKAHELLRGAETLPVSSPQVRSEKEKPDVAVWPEVRYDRVNLALASDPMPRPGVRATTLVMIDGRGWPFAMQTDCDETVPGAFGRACEMLCTVLKQRVDFRF